MRYAFLDLGFIEYGRAYRLQKEIWNLTYQNDLTGLVILAEHDNVFTSGRAINQTNQKFCSPVSTQGDIEMFNVERGGGITYHGPGQIIFYPILNLKFRKKDLRAYVTDLEEVVIRFLSQLGIKGFRKKDFRGVWTDHGKIASLGVAIRKWIAFHGIAININPEMKYFSYIKPCGLESSVMTSLFEIMGPRIFDHKIKPILRQSFDQVFN